MQQQKILIVTRSFYPENSPRSFRATELAKEFSNKGHQVTVITPREAEHEAFAKEHGIVIKDMGPLKWKEIPLKGKGLVFLFLRILKRFSNLLFQYPDIQLVGMVKKALAREKAYDLMISIAMPHPVHWGVALARSKEHQIAKVWMADCGDPFMGYENDSFSNPFYFKYVEKWFCRQADFISVPTKGAVEAYYPEFRHKIKVIPQGFNFSEIEKPEVQPANQKPVFAYAGLLIPGRRDPSELLDYLVSLDKDFEFHLYTRSTALLEPFLQKAGKRIIVHDYVPRKELLRRLGNMDFVVNFENTGNKQTPSKLIDYAIIDKPILSIKTGALDKDKVNQFLEADYSGRYVIEDPDQYKIENVCEKFLEVVVKDHAKQLA